jgi:hypothetical protein
MFRVYSVNYGYSVQMGMVTWCIIHHVHLHRIYTKYIHRGLVNIDAEG